MIVDENLKNIVEKVKEKVEEKETIPSYPAPEKLGALD